MKLHMIGCLVDVILIYLCTKASVSFTIILIVIASILALDLVLHIATIVSFYDTDDDYDHVILSYSQLKRFIDIAPNKYIFRDLFVVLYRSRETISLIYNVRIFMRSNLSNYLLLLMRIREYMNGHNKMYTNHMSNYMKSVKSDIRDFNKTLEEAKKDQEKIVMSLIKDSEEHTVE